MGWRRWAGWALLGLWLIVQYGLFRGYVEREVSWGYPPRWDQAVYLTQVYRTHLAWQHAGTAGALATAWRDRLPTGLLLPFEAAPLLRVLGGSRLSALTLPFAYFALLQVAIVAAAGRLASGWSAPALALGLLLSLHSPFWWGGLADFRLDFMAMCLWGAWLCLAVRSRAFARPGWALATGLALTAMVLLRYLTIAYVLATLGSFLALEWLRPRDPEWGARVKGTLAAVGIVVSCAGPFLWLSRDQLRAYYWSGHVEGGARLAEWAGVRNSLEAWLFYPRSLLEHHLGPTFLTLAAGLLLAAALARRGRPDPALRPVDEGRRAGLRLLACATLAPLVVLTLDAAKSDVVASVVLPGLILLVVWPLARLLEAGVKTTPLAALAGLTLVGGVAQQVAFLRGPGELGRERADAVSITRLHRRIAAVCVERGWLRPWTVVDSAQDHTVPGNTTVLGFERHGLLIEPQLPVPAVPWSAVDEPALRRALEHAQIVVVTDGRGPTRPARAVFDNTMAALRPIVRAACQRDFVQRGRFRLRGRVVLLFVRRREG